MPQFPRHSSQRQMTTQQPEPLRREAGEQAAVATEALGAMQKMAVTLDNAMVTAQLNSFKADKGIFWNTTKQQAQLDPDQNNIDKYVKLVNDYEKNALKDMSPRARQEAQLELRTDTALAKIQLQGIFHQKQVAEAVKNLPLALDGYQNEILNAGSLGERSKSWQSAMNMINENVTNGFITVDGGKRLKDEFKQTLDEKQIERDLYNFPEQFKANAAKGVYTFKSAEDRHKRIKTANDIIESREKLQKAADEKIHTLGADKLSVALMEGNLTPELVKQMLREGEVDLETAAIFEEVAVTGEYTIKSAQGISEIAPNLFLKLLDDTLDDKTKALDIFKRANKAIDKGLTKEQYGYFIDKAREKFNATEKGDYFLKGYVDAVKSWAGQVYGNVAAGSANATILTDKLTRFIEKTRTGTSPGIAIKEMIAEAQTELHPEKENYKIGDIIPGINQNVALEVVGFYPDGEPMVKRIEK